jgi:succinate dehydrogenase / fumarate reductase cytochrome b subunit
MIISGLVVLAFLGLHFYDFWVHEITYKYVEVGAINETRYFEELVHKFESPVRTGIYVGAFVLLALHLWHGFSSSFQSVGFNNKFSSTIQKLGYAFAMWFLSDSFLLLYFIILIININRNETRF